MQYHIIIMLLFVVTVTYLHYRGNKKEGEDITFNVQAPMGGAFSGELRLAGDDLSFDDVYYLAGRTPRGGGAVPGVVHACPRGRTGPRFRRILGSGRHTVHIAGDGR